MNKTTFLAFTTLLMFNSVNAQILYNETFDNYTLGDLGTDNTGITPGKGGLYTIGNTVTSINNLFTIKSETSRGKVLNLSSGTVTPTNESLHVKKTDLNTLIDQRTVGNNVIKFEIDYYTGAQHQTAPSSSGHQHIFLSYGSNITLHKSLISYSFQSTTGGIGIMYNDGIKTVGGLRINNISGSIPVLPFNTWVKFIVYLDYNNKKAYFETPYFNTVVVADFLSQSNSKSLMEDFKPKVLSLHFGSSNQSTTANKLNKYDNIKITALKNVPAYILSSTSFLSDQFNLYPNPTTNIVNITNSDNMFVNQVQIYDLSGKLINTLNFNNGTEIQLNVETLKSGTYLLHLQTDQGIAVKELIKK